MSKEAMKQALEALERAPANTISQAARIGEAITALRRALANEALDKMAENAREIGLDYEPAQQEPVAMQMDVIVVNLVREGINKHRARELAEHFIQHTRPQAREPLSDEFCITGMIDVGHYSLQLMFKSREDADKFKAAHGIKGDA